MTDITTPNETPEKNAVGLLLFLLRQTCVNQSHYSKLKASSSTTNSVSVYVSVVDSKSYFEYGRQDALIGDIFPTDGHTDCQCPTCRVNKLLMVLYRTSFDQASRIQSTTYYVFIEFSDIVRDNDSSWSKGLKLADEETKSFVLDLVTSHRQSGYRRYYDGLEVRDIVERKGKGLVILLYISPVYFSPLCITDLDVGLPGMGKTSTAETVAIKVGKPLFAISVTDVGTAAKHVESNLRRVFTLETTWQAILLMNSDANHQPNCPLASLCIHTFTLPIKYCDSDDESRALAIFRNFLESLDRNGKHEVHRIKFDGRRIRNVVTSAFSLARARGARKLEKDHLSKVWDNNITGGFNEAVISAGRGLPRDQSQMDRQ
ncbi:hypothetical protein TSTA_004600 [Talaromyces stipitatus ATCC 10500]|uniref:ATPase AAA-type core domain-containing protein n=1 Tax=Talaromyces stipitatus (strain ATCC 10500 / CBS 375.48 / QM 6759 / NRRL 1006) TaxID=441959 RepID=B8MTK8_TALSN|nr:uncharacterized protein TSTA_004600 [Talaromyces stipitatus ATCC 10500]EED12414.1 hypothetical protein TSTA_004600 [Talaromyces stipitatus ATCC 10500]